MTTRPAAPDWTSRPVPPLRHLLVDLLDNSKPHVNHAVLAVDIGEAESRRTALQRATGEAISRHAWMMHCLARAAIEHPVALTYRHGSRLVTFSSVDMLTTIERKLPGGERIPVGWTLRGVEKRTLHEVNRALRDAMKGDDAGDPTIAARRRLLRLPAFLRRLVMRRIAANPHRLRAAFGNIGLTSLHVPGLEIAAAPFPPSLMTIALGVGTISREVRLAADGTPVVRPFVHLGLAVDHAVADGMPAARFVHRLHELLATAHGLDDSFLGDCRGHPRAHHRPSEGEPA